MKATELDLPVEPFFDRYGDAVDDRIAEVVEELLANRAARTRPRLHPLLPPIALLVVAVAGISLLLRQNPVAVAVVWASAAVICGCATRLVDR
jgi:hypothetical protein